MENNQENVQNEVNNVEQNVGENKPQKSGKGKTIALMIIVLVLVLAVGIGGGYLLSTKGNENKTEQSVENKVENNTSKKIDESKDWVYDADYLGNRENKKLTMGYVGKSYTAKDNLVVPYININSDAAQKANEEIKALYEEYYKSFGTELVLSDGSIDKQVVNYTELEYKVFEIGNIVSIAIYKTTGAYDFSTGIVTYNFNLDTLDLMTLEDAAKFCGFSSKEDLIDKSNIAINNDSDMRGLEWDYKRFIIDINKNINIVVPGPGPSDSLFIVDC